MASYLSEIPLVLYVWNQHGGRYMCIKQRCILTRMGKVIYNRRAIFQDRQAHAHGRPGDSRECQVRPPAPSWDRCPSVSKRGQLLR